MEPILGSDQITSNHTIINPLKYIQKNLTLDWSIWRGICWSVWSGIRWSLWSGICWSV